MPDEGQHDFAWEDLCWDKHQCSSEARFVQVQVAEKWSPGGSSEATCPAREAGSPAASRCSS